MPASPAKGDRNEHPKRPAADLSFNQVKKSYSQTGSSAGLGADVEAANVCICGVVSGSDISVANYYL